MWVNERYWIFFRLNEKEPKVIFSGLSNVIHHTNLEAAKDTEIDVLVLKVGSSWFHLHTKAVALNKYTSLDKFGIVLSLWLHSNL